MKQKRKAFKLRTHNPALQVTRGAGRYRSRTAERVRLRWPGLATLEDGYFVGRSRLAGQLLFTEGKPLAPELDRYGVRTYFLNHPESAGRLITTV